MKAVAQSDTVNVKEVILFNIKVSVALPTTRTHETPTPALKHVQLEATVPRHQLSMTTGASSKFNFTVMNMASAENFTFNVSVYLLCLFTANSSLYLSAK